MFNEEFCSSQYLWTKFVYVIQVYKTLHPIHVCIYLTVSSMHNTYMYHVHVHVCVFSGHSMSIATLKAKQQCLTRSLGCGTCFRCPIQVQICAVYVQCTWKITIMVGPDKQRSLDSGCFELVSSHHLIISHVRDEDQDTHEGQSKAT